MDGKLHVFDSCETVLENRQIVPVIIPPTWKKSSLPAYIEKIWKEALFCLSEATRIYIIGYSLLPTDLFFRYLITVALARNDRLYELYVINPGKDVKEKCESIFDGIFIERKFKPWYGTFEQVMTMDIYRCSKLFSRFDRLTEGVV